MRVTLDKQGLSDAVKWEVTKKRTNWDTNWDANNILLMEDKAWDKCNELALEMADVRAKMRKTKKEFRERMAEGADILAQLEDQLEAEGLRTVRAISAQDEAHASPGLPSGVA